MILNVIVVLLLRRGPRSWGRSRLGLRCRLRRGLGSGRRGGLRLTACSASPRASATRRLAARVWPSVLLVPVHYYDRRPLPAERGRVHPGIWRVHRRRRRRHRNRHRIWHELRHRRLLYRCWSLRLGWPAPLAVDVVNVDVRRPVGVRCHLWTDAGRARLGPPQLGLVALARRGRDCLPHPCSEYSPYPRSRRIECGSPQVPDPVTLCCELLVCYPSRVTEALAGGGKFESQEKR